MLLGCRVVRGPDWDWKEQDGGEGSAGTVVNLHHFADGRTLPNKTVLVCWDIGVVADYRVGLNGCYDLRILDSASAGVLHTLFTCNSCMQNGIAGMRWHCLQCNDFDLCHVCYMNDSHNKNHDFERFDKSNDRNNGTKVGKRSNATKLQAKGLFLAAHVKGGRDWNYESELNKMTGLVVGITAWENVPRSAVIVKWGDSLQINHRVGYEGKVDVAAVSPRNGPYYYKEHLPIAVMHYIGYDRSASTGGEALHEGDKVTIHLNVETLKSMAVGHGGWVWGMEKAIGKTGRIVKIDDDGDVHVDFGLMKWAFYPEALVKIRDLRPGDKVRVLNNKDLVMEYQNGHGGWNNAMEKALDEQGVVLNIDKDGDAVVNVANQRWLFNSAALLLESKEEERQPPGAGNTGTAVGVEELFVSMLLEGLTTQLTEGNGIEQLILSCTFGKLDNVKSMIQRNRNLINQTSASGKTALQVACHQAHPEIVSFLLDNGAEKEMRDDGGYTALHHAAYGDKSGACVVTMLSVNANVNVIDGTDKTKVTPLHLAIQQDNEQAVVALTQFRHCDVNLQDKAGDTPLHCTILLDQNKNSKTILDNCKENLDPSISNARGFNVLHLACIKNNTEVATMLINVFPGLVSMSKEDGFLPLHLAALNNHCEMAKLLLESGHCKIDDKNNEDRTALAIAVGESDKSMIDLLLAQKANTNIEDNDGDTPLHVAIMKHCISRLGLDIGQLLGRPPAATNESDGIDFCIALFLVVRGADIYHRNHQGKTPLDLCKNKRLHDLIVETARNPPRAGTPPAPPCNPVSRSRPPNTPTQPPIPRPRILSPSPTSSTQTSSSSPVSPSQPSTTPTLPPPIPRPRARPPPIPPRQGLSSGEQFATTVNNQVTPRPVCQELGAIGGPTSPDTAVPSNLAGGEYREVNNENTGESRKRSNMQITSEIQAPAVQPVMQTRNINIQAEQTTACHFCKDVRATVIFEPCKHKVVCQPCSFRAKVCMLCQANIEKKTLPGELSYTSLSDFKKNYESKYKELEKRCDEMEKLAICQICMEQPSNVVFSSCRHKACEKCALRLRKCHVCNRDITKDEKIKTFQ